MNRLSVENFLLTGPGHSASEHTILFPNIVYRKTMQQLCLDFNRQVLYRIYNVFVMVG